jgi:3',5'-cyclic AMP phosphodiesterase CpdA
LSAVLAHLSDPHLPLTIVPSHREWAIKRIISMISWRFNRRHIHRSGALAAVMRDIEARGADALAITGDLTNLGTREECLAAARWLDRMPLPRAVIPGNHDTMIRALWSDGPGLWRDVGGMPDEETPVFLRVGDVALIGVSSAVPSPPFFASGRVSDIQIDRMEELLRTTGEQGLCRVVMIHHPPRKGMVLWSKALRGLDRFTDAVRSAGAEMVLHGHSHQGTFSTIPGSAIPVIGVTSASHRPGRSLKRAAGWNRISIHREDGGEEGSGWRISVESRRLAPDGQLHDYGTTRFSRPIPRALPRAAATVRPTKEPAL